jgi:hypothetical protein
MFEQEIELSNGSRVYVIADIDYEAASGYDAPGVSVLIRSIFLFENNEDLDGIEWYPEKEIMEEIEEKIAQDVLDEYEKTEFNYED